MVQFLFEFNEDRIRFISEIVERLKVLIDRMESVAQLEGNTVDLTERLEQLRTMSGEFEREIQNLSEESQNENSHLIEDLRLKMITLKLSMETAVEKANEELLDYDEMVINSETNWNEASNAHFLTSETPMEVTIADQGEATSEITGGPPPLIAVQRLAPGQVQQSSGLPHEDNKCEKKVDSFGQLCGELLGNDQNGATRSIESETTTVPTTPMAFTYQSLIMYNAALTELRLIKPLPPQANAAAIRQLRRSITEFIDLCTDIQIGISYIEPVLLAAIIATFNDEVFANWRGHMIATNRMTIGGMREFLATQEEILNDEWMRQGRSILSNAIQAAQKMIAKNRDKNESDESSRYALKKRASEPPLRSYADMLKNQQTPVNAGHFEAPVSSIDSSQSSSRTSMASRPQSRAGSVYRKKRSNSQVSDGKKTGTKPKEKKQKEWICLGCQKDHPLFFCPRFLSLPLHKREEYVANNNICPLCLINRHSVMDCTDGDCENCEEPHNSTLCAVSIEKKKNPRDKDKRKGG